MGITVRRPGRGTVLAVFLSVNNEVHVVILRRVKACLPPMVELWSFCEAAVLASEKEVCCTSKGVRDLGPLVSKFKELCHCSKFLFE